MALAQCVTESRRELHQRLPEGGGDGSRNWSEIAFANPRFLTARIKEKSAWRQQGSCAHALLNFRVTGTRRGFYHADHCSPPAEASLTQARPDGAVSPAPVASDARLPDGSSVLLRFGDPRVPANLVSILDAFRLNAFFGPVHEWHLLVDGRRTHIGTAPC